VAGEQKLALSFPYAIARMCAFRALFLLDSRLRGNGREGGHRNGEEKMRTGIHFNQSILRHVRRTYMTENLKDINGTHYSYSVTLDSILGKLATRVKKMRESGKLTRDALDKVRKFFRIKNIYHSNAIEGNILDVGETRLVVEKGLTITGKPLKDQAEAKNLSEALDMLEELAKNITKPIAEMDIRQIHQLILKDIDNMNAGRYRTVQVKISGSKYRPTAPESIPAEMEEYAQWLSSVTESDHEVDLKHHPILVATVAHTWLVTIHPFIDGNGRVARLILNLILMRAGFPIAIITKDDRLRYYDALEESQVSDLSALIALVIESIEESLEEYEEAVRGQRETEEYFRSLAKDKTEKELVKAKNEYEVWRNAVELLKSYFRQMAEMANEGWPTIKIYFKDFGSLEFEKYFSLRTGSRARRTWFFRIDFVSEQPQRAARYLFFFGGPSRKLLHKGCRDATLHVAREEPSGSYNYDRLDSLDVSNVPDIHEIGYLPENEKFIVQGSADHPKQEMIEKLGRRFIGEVFNKHFRND